MKSMSCVEGSDVGAASCVATDVGAVSCVEGSDVGAVSCVEGSLIFEGTSGVKGPGSLYEILVLSVLEPASLDFNEHSVLVVLVVSPMQPGMLLHKSWHPNVKLP